jgi:RNA polymerase sigma-B factor
MGQTGSDKEAQTQEGMDEPVERNGASAMELMELVSDNSDLQLIRNINDKDDPRSKEQLFTRYEGMLHGLAHKYHSPLLPHCDAYQVAALGMMKALRRFDPEKGISFKAFAYPNVEGELKKYYRDKAEMVRLPRKVQKLKRRVLLAKESFMKSTGREPTVAEVTAMLAEDEEDVLEALAAVSDLSPLSLDGPSGSGEDKDSLAEGVGMEDASFEKVEIDALLSQALKNMPPRLQHIAVLRLKEGWTQKRIANELKISQMHVSRLQGKAMQMLGELCFAEEIPA